MKKLGTIIVLASLLLAGMYAIVSGSATATQSKSDSACCAGH